MADVLEFICTWFVTLLLELSFDWVVVHILWIAPVINTFIGLPFLTVIKSKYVWSAIISLHRVLVAAKLSRIKLSIQIFANVRLQNPLNPFLNSWNCHVVKQTSHFCEMYFIWKTWYVSLVVGFYSFFSCHFSVETNIRKIHLTQ